MMEGKGEDRRSLEVLPRSIAGAHRHLLDAMETLCVLEDFLLGAQVRDVEPMAETEVPSGVVDKCFDSVTGMSNTIEQCHDQLRHIIDKLGVPTEEEPKKL